jgi:predicted RNA binding protein YcfA (HicA-like mRNA interferase family)
MIKSLTFGELESALQEFGYQLREKANHIIFQHPTSKLMIVLPRMTPKAAISSLHQRIVERTIRDDGVVDWDDVDFYMEHGKRKEKTIKKGDRLVWRVPGTGREIKVVAAAGEQDDMVVIKQNGTFSPCPVDQLRKDDAIDS